MAKKPPTLTFDAGRLLILARTRDTKRAVTRDLSARYQDAREKLADTRRRAALARENATWEHGPDKGLALENAAKLEAEAAEIRAAMDSLQLEIDAQSAASAEAARLLKSALTFAKAEGLTIPRQLQAEATERFVMGA